MTPDHNTDTLAAERLLEPALRCARGHTPANVALAQMFMAASCADDASRALDAAIRHFRSDLHERGEGLKRLNRMRELWDETPDAFASVKAVMHTLDHPKACDPRPAPETWGTIFDCAVGASPEASVALYCLGRADLLRAATDEILQRMRAWNLLTPGACVLDIGCGSGRVIEAVAPHVGAAIGIDVSIAMLQAARERCADCANTLFVRTTGHDLSAFHEASLDLVCAVDVFPYFVMSGLAQRHVGEAARVLRRAGHLLILNFSYGNDPAANERELRHLARNAGLHIRYSATQEFSFWDGTCFLLQKPEDQERSI
jgi:SAM-dependent methyltransferase